ncbi:MAG: hypothetical protein NWS46_12000, partial [Cyclobacteriaceae bacterium]|nr:hypothetical protein [Cyclobacteriaceae bacterium]
LIGMLIALFVTIGSVVAQVTKDLKGPAAKNYKPWKDKNKEASVNVVSILSKKELKGPEAKNYKPWKDKNNRAPGVKISEAKPKLKGPAAKNYKPWKD